VRERWCGALYYNDRRRAMREYEAMLPIINRKVYRDDGEYPIVAKNLAAIYRTQEWLYEEILRAYLASAFQPGGWATIPEGQNLKSVHKNEGDVMR